MKKIFLSISMAVLFLTTNAFANHPGHTHDNEPQGFAAGGCSSESPPAHTNDNEPEGFAAGGCSPEFPPAHTHDNEHEEASEAKTGSIEGIACEDILTVSVNGLVCDFCARALEKTFGKQDEVSRINVDLEKGKVAIAMKEGMTLSDEMLTKLITDSGYNVTAIDKGCEHG